LKEDLSWREQLDEEHRAITGGAGDERR
jgi:hypothetical protein